MTPAVKKIKSVLSKLKSLNFMSFDEILTELQKKTKKRKKNLYSSISNHIDGRFFSYCTRLKFEIGFERSTEHSKCIQNVHFKTEHFFQF